MASSELIEPGYTTSDELRVRWAEAQNHLAKGQLNRGYDILWKFFNARTRFYSEKHVRINGFIASLLKAYCSALQNDLRKELRQRGSYKKRGSLMNDLQEFCIATEKYDELEVLLQECRSGFRETRANSPDKHFWVWLQEDTGGQSQLAQLRQPASSFYWEDSRTYTKTWDSLKLARAPVVDPMPNEPFAITVHPDRIKCENEADAEKLKGSEVLALLERKRIARDWDILVAWDQQIWKRDLRDIARSQVPHRIWIFPEDIMECRDFEDEYSFIHLTPGQSEWMTVRAASGTKWPNEPTGQKYAPDDVAYNQRLGWGRRLMARQILPDSDGDPDQAYRIEETSEFTVKVTAPFLAWEDFEASAAFRCGLTYSEYRKMLTDSMGYAMSFEDYRAKACRGVASPNDWRTSITLDDSTAAPYGAGFLGHTPSGPVLLWRDGQLPGINIVSSRWHDWKGFQLTPNTAELELPDGHILPCLGSVTGVWAFEEDVDSNWEDVHFLVVDVDLQDSRGKVFNFVVSEQSLPPEGLNSSMFQSLMCAFWQLTQRLVVTSPELRFFAAAICPSLFRFARPERVSLGAKWKKFAQVTSSPAIDEDNRQWEETNRRDKWDRTYEKRMRACKRLADGQTAMEKLKAENAEEQARRRLWDDSNGLATSMSSLALSSSSAGTGAGAIAR